MAVISLTACTGGSGLFAEAATPTVTLVPLTPTPSAYMLTADISTPWCYGTYQTVNANVTIRDEGNNVVGAATTEYTGDPLFLAYEIAKRSDNAQNAYNALWEAMSRSGLLSSDLEGDSAQAMQSDIATMKRAGFTAADRAVFGIDRDRTRELMDAHKNPTVMLSLIGPLGPSRNAAIETVINLVGVMVSAPRYDPVLWQWAQAYVDGNDRNERRVLNLIFGEGGANCAVSFSTSVKTAGFYQFRIGTHDGPTYSFDEISSKGFAISLGMGDVEFPATPQPQSQAT